MDRWLFAAAAAVALLIVAPVVGGHALWFVPTILVVGGGVAIWWFRPLLVRRLASEEHADASTTNETLWQDTENALRELEAHVDDDECVARLAAVGRRAVEYGRRNPAEPVAERARGLLCTAAETLAAARGPISADHRQRLLEQCGHAANELESALAHANNDRALRVRLRVMERELARNRYE